jgi:hypothetical protein
LNRNRDRNRYEVGTVELTLAPTEVERAIQAAFDGDTSSEHRRIGLRRFDLKAAELAADREVTGGHALLGVREEAVAVECRRKPLYFGYHIVPDERLPWVPRASVRASVAPAVSCRG